MPLARGERKRQSNIEKHGIDFAELEVFFKGHLLEEDDRRRRYGERRMKAIGDLKGEVLSVVYAWRGNRRRLISARRARADERQEYQAKLAAG